MSEQFQEQPDGRLVSGPSLSEEQRDRGGLKFLFVAVFTLAVFSVGLIVGGLSLAPDEPSPGEVIFEEVKNGCIPVPLTPQVGPTEQDVRDAVAAQVVALGNAKHEQFIDPIPPGPVAERYPDLKFIGLVIGFNCLEGS